MCLKVFEFYFLQLFLKTTLSEFAVFGKNWNEVEQMSSWFTLALYIPGYGMHPE